MRRWLVASACLVAAGCGSVTPTETVRERFEAPEAQAARERAPDMYAAAHRAWEEAQEAEAAGDAAAAADHSTRARLLLAAAIAEADRLEVAERRLALEARARVAEERRARDDAARLAIHREMERDEASAVAAEQAARAFEEAVVDEERRYRSRSSERAALHRESAAILARRARLLLSAARSLGGDATQAAEVQALIDASEASREPADAVLKAERAVRAALRVLGTARSGTDEVTADQRTALREAAADAGFEVEGTERGTVVRVAGVFGGTSTRPTTAGRTRLERLAAILAAHPQGPVQVHAYAGGSGASQQRTADARAEAVVAVLGSENVPASRLQPAGRVDAPAEIQDVAEVVLLSYAPR